MYEWMGWLVVECMGGWVGRWLSVWVDGLVGG